MTKFGSLIQVALLYIRAKIDELWHGRSFGGPKILKGLKNCNDFRLVERDEVWHEEGHWCVAGYMRFWRTFVHFYREHKFSSANEIRQR